jgi:pilus assembly protein FimV
MGMTMVRTIRIGAAILLLLGASLAAQAAGLGKLTVNSALGQVLSAEIDLVAVQPGELDTLSARVASIEAYREARIEYSPVLRQLRFSFDKRPNGQPVLKVTSIGPINEPFVDVLIEMTWPAGRIQREYPILLDPPGFAEARVAAAAAPPPVAKAPEMPPAAAPAVSPSTAPSESPSAKAELATTPPTGLVTTAAGETYGPVEKGDTLGKIAGQVKPSTVSLEQMLVALYRENEGAFIDKNMNLLKTGQILKVPSADDVAKIEQKEANAEYRTHVANWKTYREGLAGSVGSIPPRAEATSAATGKIASAAVPPPMPAPTESKDVLKLSKTDTGKGAPGKPGAAGADRTAALQEELTAKDKALKESQSRVADLEKQIKDMQRLLDLKTGAPAKPDDKAKKAEPPPTRMAEAPKPAEPPKMAVPPPAAKMEPAKPEPTKVEPAKPSEPPKVAEAPKPAPPKPAEPAKPADTKAAPKKAPPPPPEPGLMDTLADNAMYIAAGVGGVGLLGLGGFLWSRRRKARAEAEPASGMTSAFPSDLKPATGTGKPAGGLVDTGNSSFLTDFDKTGPGQIDTDEVDPVAEAEVYIAYGRDTQAEEILKEAMARDKSRHEITLKLLEIYHARKSATAFETVAKELHDAVGDASPLWAKAAAMGAQIDPQNALYGGAAAAGAEVPAPAAPAKPDLDFDIAGGGGAAPEPDLSPSPSFDLELGTTKAATDFPLDAAADLSTTAAPAPSLDVPLEAAPAKEEKSSFDFDISGLDFPGKGAEAPAAAAPSGGDELSLDLGSGGGGGEGAGTKLELAKAYLEIGDKDGAREILEEVAREGTPAQQEEARSLIASL